MNRRGFLRKSSKLLLGGLVAGSLVGCKSLHDFYAFDGSLLNGITWSNFQLVLSPGSEGTFDTTSIQHVHVIKDGSAYKMWYTGRTGGNSRIIYCKSTNGINWSNFHMVVNLASEGTFDLLGAWSPCVIKEGSIYKMWYSGRNAASKASTLYCQSTNGINWTNFQVAVPFGSEGTIDNQQAIGANVIKDGSLYKMWYGGNNSATSAQIIYCESSDGINWINFQKVIGYGSEGTYDLLLLTTPSVIKDGATYKMWYTGKVGVNKRIIYCESTNGINWSNFHLSVNIMSQGVFDTLSAFNPSVINVGGLGKMWYDGDNGTRSILYCESR